ncbi:MAG TPA: hypothetical protein VFI26_06640 [Lysobacter sp.]|nr:hypothetical protein [Lysobacter sp.]
MQPRSYWLFGFLILPYYATASCLVTPLETELHAAKAVFVATITASKLGQPLQTLKDKQHFSVEYAYEVVRRFKGDPSIVAMLTTDDRYHDPASGIFWVAAEQSSYAPGDSILVVADGAGPASVSSIGCTPSRPWTGEVASIATSIFTTEP